MFPQLVAGPIIRFKDLDYQLRHIDRVNPSRDFNSGMELVFRGLVKKVLFADKIGILIDPMFSTGAEVSAGLAWVCILGYSLQIYFDFSGYSDMAIGIGRCLGFRFPENFKAPYTSANPAEFWRRWHISLSTWFRDYLYIPMGGNRKGRIHTYKNLMITMLLGGLWHGAAWTFVFWGFWHGVMLWVHRATPEKVRQAIPAWVAVLMLNFGVLIGWVFFRVTSMGQAVSFLRAMAGLGPDVATVIPWQLCLLIPAGYFFHYLERKDLDAPFVRKNAYSAGLAVLSAIAVMELGRDTPFIYFQF